MNLPPSIAAPPRVLVADDHALVREGVKLIASDVLGEPRFVEATDGEQALRLLLDPHPLRLAVIALQMPEMENGTRLALLARARPEVPFVVVTDRLGADAMRRLGDIPNVQALVSRRTEARRVRAALEAAVLGRKFAPAPETGRSAEPSSGLTPRQVEIRGLLRQGYSNKLIAATLGISEGTVKNHMSEILRTLNASNRTQAAGLDLEMN
jgi:DNA-binding NarL/FixJ family response regulator